MKQTKQEIYREFGIDYDPKTGKIKAPIFGWIRPLLVNGNAKIGRGAYHYSILPTNRDYNITINGKEWKVRGSCLCTCLNKNGKIACYAAHGNYNYKSVLKSLAIKTILSYEYLDFIYRAIMAQIKADNIKLVRIHAAGDFFSIEYAKTWKQIIKAYPGVTFWTYTKNRECEHVFDGLDNGNIVKSFLPNGTMNFGHCDHIMNMYRVLKASGKKVHICFCGIEEYAHIPVKHCTDCHSCAECDYVLFIEHSTEYKAHLDPLFPNLVKMILAQDTESAAA